MCGHQLSHFIILQKHLFALEVDKKIAATLKERKWLGKMLIALVWS